MESNTPETEVLRIEGNVTVPKGDHEKLNTLFYDLFIKTGYYWEGSMVPQDSPTGMRLYEVKVVEAYQRLSRDYEDEIVKMRKLKEENDKLTLSLSEELAQERDKYNLLNDAYGLSEMMNKSKAQEIQLSFIEIQALEKRLELAENTRWRTFIKWWNKTFNKLKNELGRS